MSFLFLLVVGGFLFLLVICLLHCCYFWYFFSEFRHSAVWLGSSWFLSVVAFFLVVSALLLFVACFSLFMGFSFWDFVHFGFVGCWLFFGCVCQCFAFVFVFSWLVLLFCLDFWNFGWVLCLFSAVGIFCCFLGWGFVYDFVLFFIFCLLRFCAFLLFFLVSLGHCWLLFVWFHRWFTDALLVESKIKYQYFNHNFINLKKYKL